MRDAFAGEEALFETGLSKPLSKPLRRYSKSTLPLCWIGDLAMLHHFVGLPSRYCTVQRLLGITTASRLLHGDPGTVFDLLLRNSANVLNSFLKFNG